MNLNRMNEKSDAELNINSNFILMLLNQYYVQ